MHPKTRGSACVPRKIKFQLRYTILGSSKTIHKDLFTLKGQYKLKALNVPEGMALNVINGVLRKHNLSYVRSEVITAMEIQVMIFRVVTPHRDVVEYQHLEGPCHLHFRRKPRLEYSILTTGWTAGVQFPAGAIMGFFFSSPPRPDRL
jgi:hypothetical protein